MWMLRKPDGDPDPPNGMDTDTAATFFFVFWAGWFAWHMMFAWYGSRIEDILPPGWNW